MRELMSQPEIDADPAKWLQARRGLITGTDMAGVLGAGGNYSSPTRVYWSKIAGMASPDTMAMFLGRHDEAALAALYVGEHPDIHPGYLTKGFDLVQAGLCVADDVPWMGATFDRLEEPDGAVVEFKTSNTAEGFGVAPNGDIPLHMHIQALWEAAVRGAKVVKLVVLFRHSNKLECYWITVNDDALEDIDYFRRRAHQFREDHLLPQRPPPVDGHPATSLALRSVYNVVDRKTAVVPKRLWQMALAAQKRRNAAEAALALAKNRIAELQQNAGLAITRDGQPVMQRSLSWPRRIDLKRLRADFPDAAAECTVQPAEDQPEIRYLLKEPKDRP